MWGKNKVALHSLDYRRERFAGLVPISSAEPNTPYGPIGVETRLGHLSLHDDPDKRFTGRVSLLHGLGDRQLQIIARDRIAVVGRFPLRKPSQNGVSSNKKWLIYKPPIAQNLRSEKEDEARGAFETWLSLRWSIRHSAGFCS